MSKQKKQDCSNSLNPLSAQGFSVVVPYVSDHNAEHVVESIKSIKPEYQKRIEWIFIYHEKAKHYLEENIFNQVNKTNIISISVAEDISVPELIKKGILSCQKEQVIILDPLYLSAPLMLNQVFSNIDEIATDNKLIRLVFDENENKRKQALPIYIYPRQVAGYLFSHFTIKNNHYHKELAYKRKKTGLKTETIKIQQSHPNKPASAKISLSKNVIYNILLFVKWFFVYPIKELKSKPHLHYSFIKESSFYRFLFATLAIVLFFLMPLLSLDAGLSGDENIQYIQAENYYNYFASFGKDTSYMERAQDYAYGMSFDTFTYAINKWFGIENIYETRHVINSLTGWLALLFGGMIAVLLCGWRAGLFTIILFFFSPRFLGHSYNNPKDIPFAMAYIFTIYFIIRLLSELPKLKKSTAVMIAIGIAMAISIRIGGLLLIAYLFMAVGLHYLMTTPFKTVLNNYNLGRLKRILLYTIFVAAGGYFLGLILWPYALQNPIKNPITALELMTNFSTQLKQIFNGEVIWSNKAPWYYAFKYLLISLPVIFFVGVILLTGQLKYALRKYGTLNIFILVFTFVFPIVYIIYKGSNVYGGWRHVLFAFPSIAVLAGIGFESAYSRLKNKHFKAVFFVIFIALLYHPAKHIIKNHPYEYIYYNELFGGVKNAYGEFETDYYYHSLREASEWLISNKIKEENVQEGQEIRVATSHGSITMYYFRDYTDKCKVFYFRYYDRGNKDWDYAIVVNSYIDPYQLKNGYWPPSNTIHTITVDNQPICAILKREDMNDYIGYQYLQKGENAKAIEHLEKAVEHDPRNETALYNLSNVYQKTGQLDKAIKTCYQCLEIYPDYEKVLNILGASFLQKGQLDKALGTFHKLTEVNYKYYGAYYHMGYIYIQKNELYEAVKYLKKCIEVNQRFRPAYITLSKVLDQLGRKQEADMYRNRAKQLQ